jgi:hypothetical protein
VRNDAADITDIEDEVMRLWSRLNWGTAIAAVYLAFAGATVSFVVFAVGRPVELVSADYYEQSLRHDAHMQAAANGDALGSELRITAAPDASAIEIVMPAQVRVASGTITLYRPSDRSADRAMPLVLDAFGRQRVAVGGAARGVARVRAGVLS